MDYDNLEGEIAESLVCYFHAVTDIYRRGINHRFVENNLNSWLFIMGVLL